MTDIKEIVKTLVGGGKEEEITREVITKYIAREVLDKD